MSRRATLHTKILDSGLEPPRSRIAVLCVGYAVLFGTAIWIATNPISVSV